MEFYPESIDTKSGSDQAAGSYKLPSSRDFQSNTWKEISKLDRPEECQGYLFTCNIRVDTKSGSDQAAGSYKLTLSQGGGEQHPEMHPIGDR
jgi:hypothetical protein